VLAIEIKPERKKDLMNKILYAETERT